MQDFQGVFAAFYTPITKNGAVDKVLVEKQLNFLNSSKVQGVVVGGTTGEFPYLSMKQREELLILVKKISPKLSVIFHVSDFDFKNIHKLFEIGIREKVDACMLLPPLYFPCSEEDVLAHFYYFAKQFSSMRIIAYDFPSLARNAITHNLLERMVLGFPLAGIKLSTEDLSTHSAVIKMAKQYNFSVLTGKDSDFLKALNLGVHGCISGMASFIPDLITALFQSFQNKDESLQAILDLKLKKIYDLLKTLEFPLNIAAGIKARGGEVGEFKRVISDETLSKLNKLEKQLEKLFFEEALITF